MLLRSTPVDQLGQGWRHLDVIVSIAKACIYNGLIFTAPIGRRGVGKMEVITRPTGVNRRSIWLCFMVLVIRPRWSNRRSERSRIPCTLLNE